MTNLLNLVFYMLIISVSLVSCEQDDLIESQPGIAKGISYVKAYSSNQKVLVEWHTWSGYIDFGLEAPPVKNTKLLMSTSAEGSGFEEIHIGQIEGNDSIEVTGLKNDFIYYFKLETYGFDGQKIAVSHPICTTPGNLPDEVLSFQISDSTNYFTQTNLSWSPNGEELAFIDIDSCGYKNIHILNLNTLSVRVATKHKAEALYDVSWSPSGRYLAYMQSPSITVISINSKIWIVDLISQNTWPVSSGSVDFDPDWVSDTQLIFAKGTKEPPNIPELVLLDLDNTSESSLTSDGILYKYTPNVHRTTGKILYTARKSGDPNFDIYLTSVDAGVGDILINHDLWNMSNPTWSPNGENMYFTSTRSGQNEIWSMSLIDRVIYQKSRGGQIGSSRDFATINNSGTLLAYIQLEADNSTFLKIIKLE